MKKNVLLSLTTLSVVLFFSLNVFAQSITLSQPDNNCNMNGAVFTKTSTSGGRNIFTGATGDGNGGFLDGTIQYNSGLSRWEFTNTRFGLAYFIVNISTPNPPVGINWTDAIGCGTFSIAAVLAVEFTQFDVQNTEGSKNHLTWTTASEKDNKHFDIERSTDGNTFHNIGQVKGNNKPSSYQFVDNQPFATSYYRLRQIDFDGKETLSKVISISNKGNNKLKVYPNPVSNVLTIETDNISDFQIYNFLGQQVLNGKTPPSSTGTPLEGVIGLDVSTLPQGSYFLKVGVEQVKFVKY